MVAGYGFHDQSHTIRPMKDERSPLAIGYTWSAIIATIGMEMALPPLLGAWIDRKCGTLVVFTIFGAALGMAIGLTHILKIAKNNGKNGPGFPEEQ